MLYFRNFCVVQCDSLSYGHALPLGGCWRRTSPAKEILLIHRDYWSSRPFSISRKCQIKDLLRRILTAGRHFSLVKYEKFLSPYQVLSMIISNILRGLCLLERVLSTKRTAGLAGLGFSCTWGTMALLIVLQERLFRVITSARESLKHDMCWHGYMPWCNRYTGQVSPAPIL